MMMNRIIDIEHVSKRISNYSSCFFVLEQLIGFDEIDVKSKKKLQLPNEVEINTLVEFKDYLMQCKKDKYNNSGGTLSSLSSCSSYEMKMLENIDNTDNEKFWKCNHCRYVNSIDSKECQMCHLPSNVCFLSMHAMSLLSNKQHCAIFAGII